MFEKFTDPARRVIVLAQEEARMLNHYYIGTEHLLLGLASNGRTIAGLVLDRSDFTYEKVRRHVETIIGTGQEEIRGHIPFTPRAKIVLELSLRQALQLGHSYIGPEHILLGMMQKGEGVGCQILGSSIVMSELRDAVIAEIKKTSTPAADTPGPTILPVANIALKVVLSMAEHYAQEAGKPEYGIEEVKRALDKLT